MHSALAQSMLRLINFQPTDSSLSFLAPLIGEWNALPPQAVSSASDIFLSLIVNHRFGSTSRPPEKPEVMCIIHTAPVFQFQQFTFKHGYMYWRGIRMTWHGALHYRLPLKRSEVPRYDVQAACRVVPGFAEDDDQIQSILCIGIPRLSHM
ncbi:uncharacterized protein [Littorina saxatilis]|uniref:uncharacterized protein isoform X1 n=2 Tax=Littorina saxatilis TaxID=31220 RepID=UPI0038B64FEB